MIMLEMPIEGPPDRIIAGSEREAMEWSLVLLSQGIEPILLHEETSQSWQLSIPAEQLSEGRIAIEQYERENSAWPLRQPLPWPGFAFDWTALAWAIFISTFFVLQQQPHSTLTGSGICQLRPTNFEELTRPGILLWYSILPPRGFIIPASSSASVDLPDPEAPTRPTT